MQSSKFSESESESVMSLLVGGRSDGDYIRTRKSEFREHLVFIDGPIGPSSEYRDLIELLYGAEEGEEINIFINSIGGDATTANAIVDAIEQTQASVRAILIGDCHSAATFIMLACHQVIVQKSAWALIHTASYGIEGNSNQMHTQVGFYTKQVVDMLDTTYEGFMTKEELIEIKKGVEILLDSAEITRRLEHRNKYREDKIAAESVAEKPRRAAKK